VETNDNDLLDWKITPEAYAWAQAEQSRLQQAAHQPLAQAQLFDRMRSAYEASGWPIQADDLIIPSRHQNLVGEFVRLLEEDSPKFRAFRDTVVAILSDRLNAGQEIPVA
jgi:hypothetical protein